MGGRDVSGNLGGLACRDFTRLGCGGKRRGAEACLGNTSDRDGWEAPNHHFPSSSSSRYIWNQGSSYLIYWQLGAWFETYTELEDEGLVYKVGPGTNY